MRYAIEILAIEKESLDKHLDYCQTVVEDERFRDSDYTKLDIMKTEVKLATIEKAIKKLGDG
jgi:hypothetical protein